MLSLTDVAFNKIKELLDEQNQENVVVRVHVTGGGCSGLSYGFGFDIEVNEDDTNISTDTRYKVVVDSISLQYLNDAIVDFSTEDFGKSEFIIRNPNVKATCGCGNSFTF